MQDIARFAYRAWRLVTGSPGFAAFFASFATDMDLHALALDPDALFGGTRPDPPGRDPAW